MYGIAQRCSRFSIDIKGVIVSEVITIIKITANSPSIGTAAGMDNHPVVVCTVVGEGAPIICYRRVHPGHQNEVLNTISHVFSQELSRTIIAQCWIKVESVGHQFRLATSYALVGIGNAVITQVGPGRNTSSSGCHSRISFQPKRQIVDHATWGRFNTGNGEIFSIGKIIIYFPVVSYFSHSRVGDIGCKTCIAGRHEVYIRVVRKLKLDPGCSNCACFFNYPFTF